MANSSAETKAPAALAPIPEVSVLRDGVLDDQVSGSIAQSRCPRKNALHAGRIGRDHAYRSERDAGFRDVRIHLVEPFVSHVPGARAHVRQNDRRTIGQLVHKGVESGWRVDIHLRHLTTKEVRQRPACLVFRVQIQ